MAVTLEAQGTAALGASGHEGEGRMQSVFLAKTPPPPPPPGLYRAVLSSRRVFFFFFLCLFATPSEFGHFGFPAVHKNFEIT